MSALLWGKYNPQMSEADLAHAILKDNGSPIYFNELFEQVMAIKPVMGTDKARRMAGIHTELNLDSRFIYVGQGVWGLREWMPGKRIEASDYEEDWDH